MKLRFANGLWDGELRRKQNAARMAPAKDAPALRIALSLDPRE